MYTYIHIHICHTVRTVDCVASLLYFAPRLPRTPDAVGQHLREALVALHHLATGTLARLLREGSGKRGLRDPPQATPPLAREWFRGKMIFENLSLSSSLGGRP